MMFGRRTMVCAVGIAMACLLGPAMGGAQAPAGGGEKPVMAEDILKNVQVLRGIPFDEFMGTMGFFSASLNLNCTDCHVSEALGIWARYADDTPIKQTARKMVLMVKAINQANFGGKREVTCYTCHHGTHVPKDTPSLAQQYETPVEDPNEVQPVGQPIAGAPTADQLLDKYIQAVGGAQKLAALTSIVAKGTYTGYDTADRKVPAEVYAKSTGQRTTIAHVPVGEKGEMKDFTTAFDGRTGWVNAPNTLAPELTMTGGLLDGARIDATLTFPGKLKQAMTGTRADFPDTSIDDKIVEIVQGTIGKSRVKLYFDKKTGLLLRQVRFADTVVGMNPTQVDYSDYRDVAGVKMPFHWTVTWTDGESTFDMTSIQANAQIDAAKFNKPTP